MAIEGLCEANTKRKASKDSFVSLNSRKIRVQNSIMTFSLGFFAKLLNSSCRAGQLCAHAFSPWWNNPRWSKCSSPQEWIQAGLRQKEYFNNKSIVVKVESTAESERMTEALGLMHCCMDLWRHYWPLTQNGANMWHPGLSHMKLGHDTRLKTIGLILQELVAMWKTHSWLATRPVLRRTSSLKWSQLATTQTESMSQQKYSTHQCAATASMMSTSLLRQQKN